MIPDPSHPPPGTPTPPGWRTRAAIRIFVAGNLPWVVAWARWQERRVGRTGRPLDAAELSIARRVGVTRPGRIRIAEVDVIPFPGTPAMKARAAEWGFDAASVLALSLRYGIFLSPTVARDPVVLAHECAHTAQYEELGGFGRFLFRYLTECLTAGYLHSTLERDAAARASAAFPLA